MTFEEFLATFLSTTQFKMFVSNFVPNMIVHVHPSPRPRYDVLQNLNKIYVLGNFIDKYWRERVLKFSRRLVW
jgi:hypothetical protein